MKREIFTNGCEILSFDDLDYAKISSDSMKKDLIDWCETDREIWINQDVKTIYNNLYLPARDKKGLSINMDTIKHNAMLRYAIERIKLYKTKENFIKVHGEYAYNRFFLKEKGSKLDTRWETVEELIKNGFD